jgi:hypothetical protein
MSSTGAKAIATFKAGGMFAGRGEEVRVQAFDAQGVPYLPPGPRRQEDRLSISG